MLFISDIVLALISTYCCVHVVNLCRFCPCRLFHVNPSAAQNSKNVHTIFRQKTSKKTGKELQKSGLSYHVLKPFIPHQRNCTKKKVSLHHSNLVYVNASLGNSGSAESHMDSVETQIGMSVSLPCGSAVREAFQTLPTAKAEIQALPTVDKTHMQL